MQITIELVYYGLCVLVSVVVSLLVGIWYVLPHLSKLSLPAALVPLLLFSAFRVNGFYFLIAGVASADIPKGFAVPTAYGDAVAAFLALAAAITLRYRPSAGIIIAWIYNVIGSLDLLNALAQVILNGVTPAHFGATWLLPTINVPALAVAHALMFVLLARGNRAGNS